MNTRWRHEVIIQKLKLSTKIKIKNSLYIIIYITMTELRTNELQTAINEIKKLISEKQNEKRNLESQKSKLEFSIRDLQTEIDSLKKQEIAKKREYFYNLLDYAKEKLNTLDSESNWIFKDDAFVIFKKYDAYYLFSEEDSELIEIAEDTDTARVYDLRMYEDLLDDKKSDSYNCDTFLRRQRIDEIENYYYNDSLSDYLYWIWVSDVELDDLLDDERDYIKWEDMEELDSFIESDEQYFTEREFYHLKDEEDETN